MSAMNWETDESDERTSTRVPVSGDTAIAIPPSATPAEAAAIAAAVGAHVTDRERAAVGGDEVETVDQWKLQAKLQSVGKRRYPRSVKRGEEWKAAGRSFY